MRYLILFFSLALGACTTLTTDQCQSVDWEKLGYEDGIRGQIGSDRTFHKYKSDCEKLKVTVNEELYNQGHEKGLKYLCTPVGALKAGRSGYDYNRVCDPSFQEKFDENFFRGRKEYLTNSLAEKKSSIEKLGSKIQSEKDEKQQDELKDQKKKLEKEVKDLQVELDELPVS